MITPQTRVILRGRKSSGAGRLQCGGSPLRSRRPARGCSGGDSARAGPAPSAPSALRPLRARGPSPPACPATRPPAPAAPRSVPSRPVPLPRSCVPRVFARPGPARPLTRVALSAAISAGVPGSSGGGFAGRSGVAGAVPRRPPTEPGNPGAAPPRPPCSAPAGGPGGFYSRARWGRNRPGPSPAGGVSVPWAGAVRSCLLSVPGWLRSATSLTCQ